MSDLSASSSSSTLTMSSFGRSSLQHSLSDSALDLLSRRKSLNDRFHYDTNHYERLATDLRIMFKNFARDQDRKLLLMLDIVTDLRDQIENRDDTTDVKLKEMKQIIKSLDDDRKKNKLMLSVESRVDVIERMTLSLYSEVRKMKRKSVLDNIASKTMGTEDSMSDDVFEEESLRAPAQRNAPSPTGYRGYLPPGDTPSRLQHDDDMPLHKTILLGDSGVGKTSLLVQFETGKFQSGNFSATVGIGFTVMLLGDSGVGKTCMLVRFRDGHFLAGNYVSTVGIDFRNKVVTVDGIKVKLQIWDTAGQERFRSVTHAYYRDAHALLLLYDVTNKISFDNIRAWLGEIREYAQDDVVIMLLGNKSDSGLERAVKREEGMRLAREYQVAFMETSAKTGLNVESAFAHVARSLVAKANPADSSRLAVRAHTPDQPRASACPPCS